jgi:hypothetical protein
MPPSRPRAIGWEVHHESSAVACIAHDHHAEGVFLGHRGPRPCDLAHRRRRLPSNRPPRVGVEAAGPCGAWLSRARTTQGHRCRVVAPAGIPHQAEARVTTHRREASNPARLRRAGAWADRSPAQGSRPRHRRLAPGPTPLQDRRWQAQGRWGHRDRPLRARGKHANPGVVARARDPGTPGLRALPVTTIERQRRRPGVGPSASAFCGGKPPARLERGRHPTDPRQVGPHPRRAA